MCSIRFNDEHVPGSPFRLDVEDPSGYYATENRQLSVAAVQDRGLQVKYMDFQNFWKIFHMSSPDLLR